MLTGSDIARHQRDLVEIEGDVAMGGSAAWRARRASRPATLMRKLMAAGSASGDRQGVGGESPLR